MSTCTGIQCNVFINVLITSSGHTYTLDAHRLMGAQFVAHACDILILLIYLISRTYEKVKRNGRLFVIDII